jgi:thimet oligopeptidase
LLKVCEHLLPSLNMSGTRWLWSPREANQILRDTRNFINDHRRILDEIVAKSGTSAKHKLFGLFLQESLYESEFGWLTFDQHMFPDKEIRDACTESEKMMDKYSIEASQREDVWGAFNDMRRWMGEHSEHGPQTQEQQRFLEKRALDYKRGGMELPKEVREQLNVAKTKLAELCVEFQKNIRESDTELAFTSDDLRGVPLDIMERFKKSSDGKWVYVSTKYPDYEPVMDYCTNDTTRQLLYMAFNQRAKETNRPILTKMVELRRRIAAMGGYESHAEFVLETRMAKNPDTVLKFLQEVVTKMAPLGEKERNRFVELKQEEQGGLSNGRVDPWDTRRFGEESVKRDYQVDRNELRKYFPVQKVVQGTLDIYQRMLGLKFVQEEGAPVWFEGVTRWRVHDSPTDALMGYFYLDLYPREGKFSHAAVFPLAPGTTDPTSKVHTPAVAAMLCNFSPPSKDEKEPSMLSHDEVETFFHEFGHVMHNMCSEVELPKFAGTQVERDFVECPSQMLENWVWQVEPLRAISGHWKTGEPIPDSLLGPLLKSRQANSGTTNLRQLTFGIFDQRLHGQFPYSSLSGLMKMTRRDVEHIDEPNEACMPCSWGHMSGYDAQYYGYMWSLVFAADMFKTRFLADGLFESKAGKDYRRMILAKGGSLDASEMLRDFLGRDPSTDAFFELIGVGG